MSKLVKSITNGTIKAICHILMRIDSRELAKVPAKGPLLVVANHVNSIEVPLIYVHMMPRRATGYAKVESWDNPLKKFLFDQWGGIPLTRGEADLGAVRKGLEWLEGGGILAIAPEGTRSYTGILQQGKGGVAFLALKSGAPVLPMVYYGHESFWHDLKRLRRGKIKIAVGNPFTLDPGGERVTSEMRQEMIDEVMYQLASLLPPKYRGVYSNLSAATSRYLKFAPGVENNLAHPAQ